MIASLKPLENIDMPSYVVSNLNDNSLIICKMIETYIGTDFNGKLILLKSGFLYELIFKLMKALQEKGFCYFVEKIEVKYE
ncbi:hypothetical protein HYW76_02505 [Candidatus Pacearchaeota archaeon]|nr:hypothetical protein [Candidatus Pacearchaeota archaeon]